MLLSGAHVKMFRSIEDSGTVSIDNKITVLVGQNESGKTAFLQALEKARSVDNDEKYVVVDDYPRKSLITYERTHKTNPDLVAVLTYSAEKKDIDAINADLGFPYLDKLIFSINHHYSNTTTVSIDTPEQKYVEYLLKSQKLSKDASEKAASTTNLREFIEALSTISLNEADAALLKAWKGRFTPNNEAWKDWLDHYIYSKFIEPKIPKFLYFDDYKLLPGKVNLATFQQTIANSAGTKQPIADEYKTVMSLFRMAGIGVKELSNQNGYETIKAKLEGVSNLITDKLFHFWKQNTELDVEFDIRSDPHDRAPYNSGDNLYIRIRNRRHRVSVPFSQRSKGFIWFFSFIVWFDGIKEQLGTSAPLVLLLDEPGLSLHALAQADFLNYIETLSRSHQVIYTTHSPFMVGQDRLDQVRVVEDRVPGGTKVSSNISMSDEKTVFPLQAALGYTIAQNLFISKRNLLVEGPSDLIYLKIMSGELEQQNKEGLRDDVTIVPVGGLDKLSTFVSLLGANHLELAILHDYQSGPDQNLQSLIWEKLIRDKSVLNYGLFKKAQKTSGKGKSVSPAASPNADVEDLFNGDLYLEIFNRTFSSKLPKPVKISDLPAGDRIADRLTRFLATSNIQLRPSGGFNHYLVAHNMLSEPSTQIDSETLENFERLFAAVNPLFS